VAARQNSLQRRAPLGARRRRGSGDVLFLLPVMFIMSVAILVPAASAVSHAFTDWEPGSESPFVGLENFKELFESKVFREILANQAILLLGVPLWVVVPLGVAFILHQGVARPGIFRAIFFFPVTASIVAVSLLWAWMYTPDFGIINYLLSLLGLPKVKWLVDPTLAMPSVIIMSVWRGLGFNIVVFLAGLQSIPRDLYEAAELDGAGGWNQFRDITVPLLTPTIFFATITSLIASFQVFEQTYIMTQGGPGNATLTLVYQIFLNGFTYLRMGYASALSFVLFAILFVITILQVRLQTRWVHYA
jgi:multiple sugar transport system permease protein